MTIEEIEAVLERAAAMRFPTLHKDDALGLQIETLQDYLVATAQCRGELEEARMWAYVAKRKLTDEWDYLTGWEGGLPETKRPTAAQVKAAKAAVRPDLASGIDKAEFLVRRLTDQIDRLALDDKAASRVYTMLTGS